MTKILKVKHWQLFLVIILTGFINDFKTIEPSTLNDILTIVGIFILIGWLILTGHELYKLVPAKIDLNNTLFIINSFLCLSVTSIIIIVTGSDHFSAQGIEAIPGIYLFYAYLHLHAFPARALKSIELGRKAKFSDYIGEFFLFLFWPIGIWVLQPRINKIAEENRLLVVEQE